jgi:hypothetical protein
VTNGKRLLPQDTATVLGVGLAEVEDAMLGRWSEKADRVRDDLEQAEPIAVATVPEFESVHELHPGGGSDVGVLRDHRIVVQRQPTSR